MYRQVYQSNTLKHLNYICETESILRELIRRLHLSKEDVSFDYLSLIFNRWLGVKRPYGVSGYEADLNDFTPIDKRRYHPQFGDYRGGVYCDGGSCCDKLWPYLDDELKIDPENQP